MHYTRLESLADYANIHNRARINILARIAFCIASILASD